MKLLQWAPKLIYFFNSGTNASIVRYDVVFLDAIGVNPNNIGILKAVGPIVSFGGSFLLSRFADAYKIHRFVLMMSTVMCLIFQLSILFPFVYNSWFLLVLSACLTGICRSAFSPIIDSFVLELCDIYKWSYGSQRLWAAVGWGVCGLVTGHVINKFGEWSMFLVYGVGTVIVIILLLRFYVPPHQIHSNTEDCSDSKEISANILKSKSIAQTLIDLTTYEQLNAEDEHSISYRENEKPTSVHAAILGASSAINNHDDAPIAYQSQDKIEHSALILKSKKESLSRSNSPVSPFEPVSGLFSLPFELTHSNKVNSNITDHDDFKESFHHRLTMHSESALPQLKAPTAISTAGIIVDPELLEVASPYARLPSPPPLWLSRRVLIALIANMFFFGMAVSVVEQFLFLYIGRELKGSPTLMGAAQFTMTACEVPIFIYADQIARKLGNFEVFLLSHLTFALRVWAYTLLSPSYPWLILLLEPLHGITFALMWTAAVQTAKDLAPTGCEATYQSLVSGVHYGLGLGVGSWIAGIIWDLYGASYLYRGTALFTLGWMLIFVCLWPKNVEDLTMMKKTPAFPSLLGGGNVN